MVEMNLRKDILVFVPPKMYQISTASFHSMKCDLETID